MTQANLVLGYSSTADRANEVGRQPVRSGAGLVRAFHRATHATLSNLLDEAGVLQRLDMVVDFLRSFVEDLAQLETGAWMVHQLEHLNALRLEQRRRLIHVFDVKEFLHVPDPDFEPPKILFYYTIEFL